MHAQLLKTLTGTRKLYEKLQQTLSTTAFIPGDVLYNKRSILHLKFEVIGS